MAHPERFGSPYGRGLAPDEGISFIAAFKKLFAAGINHLVAIDKFEYSIISKRWQGLENDSERKPETYLFAAEDHSPLSDDYLESIWQIAKQAAHLGEGLVIYCGMGFGRSGLAAAYIMLKVQQEAQSMQKKRSNKPS